MFKRDADGVYFTLRLSPRVWFVIGRWNAAR